MIHHCLEGARRICEAKEHDQGFEQAIFCLERSLFFVSRFNPDVVISSAHIKFCKDVGVLYLTDEVWYKWQRILIADCVFVQFAIVLYWT